MKRIIRIVWISALTGLAFLVACTCHNKLSKQEKKALKERRSEIVERLDQFNTNDYHLWEANLLNPNSDLGIGERMNGLEILSKDNKEEIQLRQEMHEIDSLLNDTTAMKKDKQSISNAMAKQKFIKKSIEDAIPPCVYGPPEVMGRRNQDIEEPIEPVEEEPDNEGQDKRDPIYRSKDKREGGVVYGPPPTQDNKRMSREERKKKIEQMEKEVDSIGNILKRREGACVYGSPEIIQRYNQETERLRTELSDLIKELYRLKHEK